MGTKTEPSIGEQIRTLRRAREWAQLDLAILLDVDPQTISRWEMGKTRPGRYFRKRILELITETQAQEEPKSA